MTLAGEQIGSPSLGQGGFERCEARYNERWLSQGLPSPRPSPEDGRGGRNCSALAASDGIGRLSQGEQGRALLGSRN